MAKRKYNKKKKRENLKVNPQLPGFDIRINSFGEIQSNYEIDEVNKFLDKNLEDKKLKETKKGGKEEGKDGEKKDE
jgi:hypothetical protein